MTAPGLNAESLQRFLTAVVPERGATVLSVTALTGGYSRDTAIGEVRWGDGSQDRVVLRADPPADQGVFVSDRDSEWVLLRALADTGPAQVPLALWYDGDGSYFGTKCIINDFYDGRPLQELSRETSDLTEMRNTFVESMVDIHRTPLDTLPAEMERPTDWDNYIDGLIDLLDHYSRTGPDSRPALRYAATRLRAYRPPPVPFTLVHGDCQPGNFLVGAVGPKVIDWEFGRIGDPREDIGYYRQMPVLPNLYVTDPEAFLARYRSLTGMTEEELNQDVVQFFLLLGLIRLYGQEMEGADAVAEGRSRGVMATYLINAISQQFSDYFEISRRLGALADARGTDSE